METNVYRFDKRRMIFGIQPQLILAGNFIDTDGMAEDSR